MHIPSIIHACVFGVTKQMNEPGCLILAFSMKINVYPKFRLLLFKCHVTINKLYFVIMPNAKNDKSSPFAPND